ncbi:TPA: response regulator [Pseudomonas putida]|uniref:response regulator n=1 Tax=Pseudomonas putida TaxID=303 RepID=UPI00066A187E|nr:response regulator [Pseudomonas putida]
MSLRVLVVDDALVNRLLLSQQLDHLGHQAQLAEDGAQALRLWLGGRFDGVITDCNMPRLDGYALARAIREHERRSGRPQCRVIGMSATVTPAVWAHGRAAGMDDCLLKPLSLKRLVQTLAQISPAVLDLEHVQRLVGYDEAALQALLDELRTSNFRDLQQLSRLQGNVEALGVLAHRIKGAARIARAKEVVYRCERLERRCSDKTLAPEHLKKDVEALRQAMLYLDRQLASHAGWSNHAE